MRRIENYPMQTVMPTTEHIMWIFDGEFQPLDNFAPYAVQVNVGYGLRYYRTGEHAFAAAKAKSQKVHDEIADLPTPDQAKSAGRMTSLRDDWQEVKFDLMYYIVREKFKQHYPVRRCLRSTLDRPIFEGNTWGDRVWGVTRRPDRMWQGRNALGEILMEIRKDVFSLT